MSSQHGAFETSVKNSGPVQLATVATAETTKQTSIDAANSVVGYNLQTGNNATLVSTTITAALTLAETRNTAEKIKQASVAAAKEALRLDTVGDGNKF